MLGRWAGWGALAGVFDEQDPSWAGERRELHGLVDDEAWASARRTTLNAHYTDAQVAAAVWEMVGRAGFAGGAVLEPGCGAGNFFGLAPDPEACAFVGVELDPTTARIAQALYPDAGIRAEGFEKTRFPDGSFDLAIGNVPFGDFRLVDPVSNRAGHNIHNHFVLKALDLTREGGYVALITSRYTLDAASPAARAAMYDRADLVGAMRLPAGTFRAAAGTNVICDMVVLRRREPGRAPGDDRWLSVGELHTPTGAVPVNQFFVDHPELIVGDAMVGRGQYRDEDLVVARTDDFDRRLAHGVDALVRRAEGLGLTYTPKPPGPVVAPVALAAPPAGWKEGSIHRADGRFVTVVAGTVTALAVRAGDVDELAALVELRDTATDLLDVQARSGDDPDFAGAQGRLNGQYDAYVARWGPLNRSRVVATGRVDPETGEVRTRKLYPTMGGFRADADAPTVMALENFDEETGVAQKAAIFSRRVVAPRPVVESVESPAEALAVCLDQVGRPDLDRIATLLDLDPAAARAALGELVWDDPADGELVAAGTYLSGNVRAKLAEAQAAATTDPQQWAANVAALERVIPEDLGPGEIDARPGATWIPEADLEDFVVDVLGAREATVTYEATTGNWIVKVPAGTRHSVAMSSEWGTDRMAGYELLAKTANQTVPSVYDTIDDRRVLNLEATLTARAKQDAIVERFGTWIWEDDDRAARLAARYNDMFNATVVPSFDGSHLSLPGLVEGFTPHDHQRDAVWRVLSEPTVLLAHEVGAGKTATMVMAAMELRRVGLVSMPAIVVPNHMLEQFTREAKQLYPQANLLVAGADDVSAKGRKGFVARAAMGNWDAVIITHSAFERIPVSAEARARFVTTELDDLRLALSAATAADRPSVKGIEKAIVRRETKLAELLAPDRKDDGVTFEATGIDYVAIDEAHLFKNLETASSIPAMASSGSQRAMDLNFKLQVLRERNGGRVATLATATPIANSIAEMHVMQRYLQPEALAQAGVSSFDAWAANFARPVTELELAPDGGSYRMATRFARFANVPDLTTMFRAVADVRTAADLHLATPDLAGGGPETVIVPTTAALSGYVESLVGRAERVRNRLVTPAEDNMLKVTGDGRRAALDLRLVGETPEDPTKAQIVAGRVAEIYHRHAGDRFVDPATGTLADRAGALQLVFCDLGTPKPGAWSVYAELREQLAERGVPAGQVRFVHEAGSDRAKADLFAACRDGRVAVLIGSTEKMGVGTNVQDRAIALHHMDCPWRPADLAQRDGRIIRQGNQNPQVHVVRYATEASFDVYMWQTVQRKSAFLHQITAGTNTARGVEDVGDATLSFAEVKALDTGNPLIIEHAELTAQHAQLTRLAAAHHADQTRLGRTATRADRTVEQLAGHIGQYEHAITRRVDTHGDAFRMTIAGTAYTDRRDAGTALQSGLQAQLRSYQPQTGPVAQLAGFDIFADLHRDWPPRVTLHVDGTPIRIEVDRAALAAGNPVSLIRRLEQPLHHLDDALATARHNHSAALDEATNARARIGLPFPRQDQLATVKVRLDELTTILTPTDDHPTEPAVTPPPTGQQPVPGAGGPLPQPTSAPSNTHTPRRSRGPTPSRDHGR